ncbi:MAG TPA: xanthine dehydrogenase family protein subunit M [candidate division Zixibacteria bacterium]|nr:xanthine dehydrogenase family protein subunit M [candidate division Zixibacteria bacterium]
MPKDMMANFQLFQPTDIPNALELADRYGEDSWIIAGGQDSLDWFKDRAKQPKAVIDINGIEELKGIRETTDGIEIGALTTLTEIESHALIKEKYSVLSDSARRVASPQIRNVGTIGGNISQDARCWYYRYGLDCYRAGGNTCYADTPEGIDREHCLYGSDRCIAVSPSDVAPALVVLDAKVVIVNADGERTVPIEEFHIGPGIDITRMTVLQAGDIVKSIQIPDTWADARFYFEKVADRNTWDFPLVNISSAMKVDGGKITDIRIAMAGVECVPRRMTVVEEVVRGESLNEDTANLAASSASRGATTLNYNHFKIPLMENLVKRAIRES